MVKGKQAKFVPQYKEPRHIGLSLRTAFELYTTEQQESTDPGDFIACFACPNATEMEFLFYVIYTVANVTQTCYSDL